MKTLKRRFRGVLAGSFLAVIAVGPVAADSLDHWHQRDAGASNYISALTFDPAGLFVAVDQNGPLDFSGRPSALLKSRNGRHWERGATGTNDLLTDRIAAANGQLRAVRYSQYAFPIGELSRSTDGVTWTTESLDFEGDSPVAKSVKRVNGQWLVAAGPSPNQFISIPCGDPFGPPCPAPTLKLFFSTNGTSWRTAELEVQRFGSELEAQIGIISADIAYGNGAWVVLAWVYDTSFIVNPVGPKPVRLLSWRSTDGTNFARHTVLLSTQANLANTFAPLPGGVAFGNSKFVAVAGGGSIYSSVDGMTWATNSPGASLRDVAFGGGQFVAVGAKGGFSSGAIVTSSDGVNWQQRESGTTELLRQVEYGDHTFLIVGGTNLVLQSDPILTLGLSDGAERRFTLSAPVISSCRIEFTSDLNTTEPWEVLTNVSVNVDPLEWPAPSFTGPRRFFRAVLQP